MFRNFLFICYQRRKFDGARSSVVNVVSGVLQCSESGLLFLLLYIADLPPLLENNLIGYVDDSTRKQKLVVAGSINKD